MKRALLDYLEERVPDRYYLTADDLETKLTYTYKDAKTVSGGGFVKTLKARDTNGPSVCIIPFCICAGKLQGHKYEKWLDIARRVYDAKGVCPTLTTVQSGGRLRQRGHRAPALAKGLYILDYWTTTSQATVKELTADTIAAAMTAAKKTTEENVAGYDVIVPKSAIELDDYTENVTYIGRLVGSEKPIIIQIFNAFNTNDLSIQPKDNDEASVQSFHGHYDPNDLETPPYKIYWPKEA